MAFSQYLDSKRADMKALVKELRKSFSYASVLGVDIRSSAIRADRNTSGINPGRDTECGFVVKMYNGNVFYEYSLDDISGDMTALAKTIADGVFGSAADISAFVRRNVNNSETFKQSCENYFQPGKKNMDKIGDCIHHFVIHGFRLLS